MLPKQEMQKSKMALPKNDEKEILLIIAELGLVGKELQNHKYCHKNHKRVPSKSSYYTPNTSMENFTPDLNSAIDIIEQRANLEPRDVPVYCFLQAIGYDQKDKSCHRFMKSKLSGKYNHRETSYSNFK